MCDASSTVGYNRSCWFGFPQESRAQIFCTHDLLFAQRVAMMACEVGIDERKSLENVGLATMQLRRVTFLFFF
jgi:hypothetical protein